MALGYPDGSGIMTRIPVIGIGEGPSETKM